MELIKKMMKFINESPCNYWAVENASALLADNGYRELSERDPWELQDGGKYYVKRNSSSLIAFRYRKNRQGFLLVATHSDSPCFKVKENPEVSVGEQYTKLLVEPYGGMILAPWLDRPLSLAGRVFVKEKETITENLVRFEEDMLLIPNVAVHLNKEINNGYVYKKHVDMQPLWGSGNVKGALNKVLAEKLGCSEDDILEKDLFVYNPMKCSTWGYENAFLSGPRLDDLECAYLGLSAFVESEGREADNKIPVFCLFDNEEVGSGTRQGAESDFLKDVLLRILLADGGNREDYCRAVASSFLVSADNAHGVHPNAPELSDGNNACSLNGGVVIKYQASQRYSSDGFSGSVFTTLCEKAGVKYQRYANRSDMPGGSTLGNISATKVAIPTVDIGLAQLAMHSPYETAGQRDVAQMHKALRSFYGMHLEQTKEKTWTVEVNHNEK